MCAERFPSNKPQSVAGGENYVLKDHMFSLRNLKLSVE